MMGPPGAGKGTQSIRLAAQFGVVHVSTGDMFRAAVSSGSEIGRRATSFMDAGRLVPDEVTLGIVRERLSEPDAKAGFILDGFPRTVAQGEGLTQILKDRGAELDAVVLIEVADDILIQRAAGRVVCNRCGRVFHLEYNPPTGPSGGCACGGTVARRADDSTETVRARLAVYRAQTEPLKSYYASRGLLVAVDGRGGVDDVYDRIVKAFGRCMK